MAQRIGLQRKKKAKEERKEINIEREMRRRKDCSKQPRKGHHRCAISALCVHPFRQDVVLLMAHKSAKGTAEIVINIVCAIHLSRYTRPPYQPSSTLLFSQFFILDWMLAVVTAPAT